MNYQRSIGEGTNDMELIKLKVKKLKSGRFLVYINGVCVSPKHGDTRMRAGYITVGVNLTSTVINKGRQVEWEDDSDEL